MAQDLIKRYMLDAQRQVLWLPATCAQVALDRKNPSAAKQFLALGKTPTRTFPS
jgi:hypothetical protein